ncbi:MAG: hypothetical protein R3F49_09190 [Planctomycetota bacterium]
MLGAGCEGPGSSRRADSDRRNLELFNELIGRGTMQPAESFDEDSYFDRIAEAYADAPRADRVLPPVAPRSETAEGDASAAGELPAGGGEGATLGPGEPELGTEAPVMGPTPSSTLELNPYLEFGAQIVWYPAREGETERLIMKPYPFPLGMGTKIFELAKTYGDFAVHAAVTEGAFPKELPLQPLDAVVLDLREGWIVETYSDPRTPGLAAPAPVRLGDMLFVTATAQQLREVEHFVNLFAAEVRQIEIEAKIVEVTTRDSLDLGVRGPGNGSPVFGLPNPGGFVQSVDFSFGNSADAAESLFALGAVFDGVTFNAVLEAVANFENVSIISRPKVAVREGGRAEIVNISSIPFFEVSAINAAGNFTTNVRFKDVGVKMYVIPRVVGTDTVVLNIDIEASQQTGTAVTFTQGSGSSAQSISVPEISSRNARTIVRLEPGQAVILGGLISERTLDRESKVPFVGDIPLLGHLFKNSFRTKEQTNVLFFIRPRILEGSDLNSPF